MPKDEDKYNPLKMPIPEDDDLEEIVDLEAPKTQLPSFPNQQYENPLIKHAKDVGVFLTSNNQEVIDKFSHRAKYGHQGALPMQCRGDKCNFISMCPLHEMKVALPIGKRCPVVASLVEIWANKLIASLNIEVDNPEYAVDLDMVYELAGLELIRNRASVHLSDQPELFKEKIVGFSPHGKEIYDDKMNLALIILEKYGKRVDKLRDQLLATRGAQAKVGKIAGDNSIRSSNIMERARKLAEQRRDGTNIADAEFYIKDKDSE